MSRKQTAIQPRSAHSSLRSTVRRLILFCAILISGGNLLIPRTALAVITIFAAILYLGHRYKSAVSQKIYIYLWLGAAILVSLIYFQISDALAIVVRLSNFYIALALLNVYWGEERYKLPGDLLRIIYPMAFQAVLTVLFAIMIPAAFLKIHTAEAKFNSLVGLLNYHVMGGDTSLFVRPDGLFYEPGVYQFYLNILLYVLLMQKRSWGKIALTLLAILATQSTTGYVIAGVQIAYFILISDMWKRVGTVMKIFRFAVILVAALPLAFILQNNLQSKLYGDKVSSTNARQYDLIAALLVIKNHPITGIGFSHQAYLQFSDDLHLDLNNLSEHDQAYGRQSTNGLLMICFSVGIPLGVVYLAGFCCQRVLPHRLILAVMMLFTLGTEALPFTPFFAFFAFYGLCRNPQSKRKIRRQMPGRSSVDASLRLPTTLESNPIQ